MPCRIIRTPDGQGIGIACGRGQRQTRCDVPGCFAQGTKLCDFPLAGAKAGKTCDARICAAHATNIGPDKDLCPPHAKLAAEPDHG